MLTPPWQHSRLEDLGIRYDDPPDDTEPAISEQEAIEAAKSEVGSARVEQASGITARLILFSDQWRYEDVPAWAVVFEDVLIAGWGRLDYEYINDDNIIIDATTGHVLAHFSY